MLNPPNNYKYILALDPSGSFLEGKGTTGWCVLRIADRKIVAYGTITAKNFQNRQLYWSKHKELILKANEHYEKLVVVFEDYFLYANQALKQVNSRMETSQLLGVLKFLMDELEIPYYIQTAAEVKTRWADKVLLWKKILFLTPSKHFVTDPTKNDIINGHIRDAIRHAIHFSMFGGKYDKGV